MQSVVGALRHTEAAVLRVEARKGLRLATREGLGLDRDYRRDCAADAVESYCLNSPDWETVKATEISDLACDIADEVETDDWIAGRDDWTGR